MHRHVKVTVPQPYQQHNAKKFNVLGTFWPNSAMGVQKTFFKLQVLEVDEKHEFPDPAPKRSLSKGVGFKVRMIRAITSQFNN
jgi:hypothetical protein